MCECITNIETKLLAAYKKNYPDATGHRVSLDGYGLGMVGGDINKMRVTLFLGYSGSAEHPLKKGGTRTKKVSGSLAANYCPFCGESLKEEEKAA